MAEKDMDAVDKPLGDYCPTEHKNCDEVERCVYRADNGGCLLKLTAIRKLGTMKRTQRTYYKVGEALVWLGERLKEIWRDPNRVSSHDRIYADKADRD